MRGIDLAAFLAIARKEAEKAIDPPAFEVRDGHLFAIRRGKEKDLGDIRGPLGPRGESIKGDDGPAGLDGKDGKDGVSIKGESGLGISGAEVNDLGHLIITYSTGATSDLGKVRGEDGKRGPPGKDGKNGAAGKPGSAMFFGGGASGSSGGGGGEPGADGASAYEIAVDNGFTGTESEWLASLVGSDGADAEFPAGGSEGDILTRSAGGGVEWMPLTFGIDGGNASTPRGT